MARDTRVCVYDRAGRGWSEPADSPQDAAQIAADLRTALHRANVPGPYVLAGHSFGGLYGLTFAAQYPDDTAGMVLVDSTAPSEGTPGTAAACSDLMSRASALLSSSARLGLGRLTTHFIYGDLPPQSRDELQATDSTASALGSTIDEYVQGSASMDQAGALTDFADKPLVVLTAGEGNDADWVAKHEQMAAFSTNSAHRVVDGATHQSLIFDKEDDAADTTRAILDVVSAVRSSAPVGR